MASALTGKGSRWESGAVAQLSAGSPRPTRHWMQVWEGGPGRRSASQETSPSGMATHPRETVGEAAGGRRSPAEPG